jgi:DNA-binding transcriptional ArsR family regulator
MRYGKRMKEGPDIARIASLIGDPARANMLAALSDGRALTASELAAEAGVTKQTASSHLARLSEGGLLAFEAQGRHRYFRLAGEDVGHALEALMGLAAVRGRPRTRTSPSDPALRRARVCYGHLAGELGVHLFSRFGARRWLSMDEGDIDLTPSGRRTLTEFGIDIEGLSSLRRPLCRPCLDWSERRHHLAGSLGQALFTRFTQLGWARREKASRVVRFTPGGERAFARWLG